MIGSFDAKAANSFADKTVRLYVVRHAQPDVPHGLVYGLDVPVLPISAANAAKVASVLPDKPYWVSSKSRRAIDTLFAVRAAKGEGDARADLDIRAGFVEQNFGRWTDKMRVELIADPQSGFRDYLADLDNAAPPEGESLQAMSARVLSARDALMAELAGKACNDVVIVCHGGPIRALWAEATGRSIGDVVRNADRTFTCGYLSVARIDVQISAGKVAGLTPVSVTQLATARNANVDVHLT